MNVYLVVEKEENGVTRTSRVPATELCDYIRNTFILGGIEILAIVKL